MTRRKLSCGKPVLLAARKLEAAKWTTQIEGLISRCQRTFDELIAAPMILDAIFSHAEAPVN